MNDKMVRSAMEALRSSEPDFVYVELVSKEKEDLYFMRKALFNFTKYWVNLFIKSNTLYKAVLDVDLCNIMDTNELKKSCVTFDNSLWNLDEYLRAMYNIDNGESKDYKRSYVFGLMELRNQYLISHDLKFTKDEFDCWEEVLKAIDEEGGKT